MSYGTPATFGILRLKQIQYMWDSPSGASDFHNFAATATPPGRRERPVGGGRTSCPALLWEQQHLYIQQSAILTCVLFAVISVFLHELTETDDSQTTETLIHILHESV
jgi:hypothetical protein